MEQRFSQIGRPFTLQNQKLPRRATCCRAALSMTGEIANMAGDRVQAAGSHIVEASPRLFVDPHLCFTRIANSPQRQLGEAMK